MKRRFIGRVALALVLALVLGSASLLAGCNSDPTFDYKYGSDYLATEDLELAAPLTTLSVHWINGNVEIRASDVEGIHIYEDSARDEGNEHSFYYYVKDETTLMIEAGKAGTAIIESGKTLVIEISEQLTPALDTLTVTTEGANIGVENVVCRKVALESVSGEVSFTGTAAELSTANVSGQTTLSVSGAQSIEHSSVSGDAVLALQDCAGYTVTFDTVSGIISCPDAQASEMSWDSYVYGDGSAVLDLITITGNVTVSATPPSADPTGIEVAP